jgi:hypothetical protein
MKPAQKIVVSCRQTAESARRLCDWLDANRPVLNLAHDGVSEEIEGLAARLGSIAAAAEAAPGIGFVGTPGSGKHSLILQILAARGQGPVGEFGSRPLDIQTLRNIMPAEDGAGGSAVVRLSAAEMPPTPRGHPVRIGLLSLIDIAAILAASRLSASGPSAEPPSSQTIEALFEAATSHVSLQTVPGISERDVLALREHLNGSWGGHPLMAALCASRYWDRLKDVAAHLAEAERRKLMAVLWSNDPATSALFDRLADALERLGHGADAYCSPDALIGKDRLTGWHARHPRSIIDISTLLSLERGSGPMVTVMNRYGQSLDIERSVLAALISELPLNLGSSRLTDLLPAELLDFPSAPQSSDIAPDDAASDRDGGDGFAAAVGGYARAKAGYLFERAVERRDVTSLVITIDPTGEDDSIGPAVADWIETAQGPTSHARERVRRGLFLAAGESERMAAAAPAQRAAATERALDVVRSVLGSGQTWATHWTPGRPLSEVYWFQTGEATQNAPVPPADDLATAPTPAAGALTLSRGGGLAVARASDLQASRMGAQLLLASSPRAKLIQLSRAVAETRRRLRSAVARHQVATDPASVAEWRRSVAVVVANRLQYLTEQGRLGHVQRALIPSEDELIRAMATAHSRRAGNGSGHAGTLPVPELDASKPQTAIDAGPLADAAISYWIGAIKRIARSNRQCRDLAIEPGVMQHLTDELQLGAVRIGLAGEIAGAYRKSSARRASEATDTTAYEIARLAAYACRITAAYLEVLGDVSGRGQVTTGRSSRFGELEVADPQVAGYASIGVRPRAGARRSIRLTEGH